MQRLGRVLKLAQCSVQEGILRMLWSRISRLRELFYVYNCFMMFVLHNACMWCLGMIKTFVILTLLDFFQKPHGGIEGLLVDA